MYGFATSLNMGAAVGTAAGFGGGTFAGHLIPGIGFTLIAPEPLFSSVRWMQLHRKVMKDVLKTVLYEWHEQRLPDHFKPGAKQKYGYQERQEATQKIKLARYRHVTELVQSGKTARTMQTKMPKVTFQGTGDRYLEGLMRYRFPFPTSRDAKEPRFVTIAKMGDEIASWTTQEMKWAINRFAELYALEMEHALARQPRKRAELNQRRLF